MLVELLPNIIASNLSIITLLIVGFFVEEHYVGRITVLSNSVALNLYVARLTQPGALVTLFADVGILLGALGFLTYLTGDNMSALYYLVTYFLYSSATVGLVILLASSNVSLLFAVIIGSLISYGLLDLFEELAVAN